MKILSSTFHGYIDYATAVALIAAPFLLFPAGTPGIATWLSVAAGVGLIIYSLITDYSVSARKAIPFKMHLILDFIAGVVFVAAPFVLGFVGIVKLYYLVMGLAVIVVVLTTNNDVDVQTSVTA